MLKDHNQTFPFLFDGAADDPVYYAALKTTTSVTEHAEVTPSQSSMEWTVGSPNGAVRATVMLDESHGIASYRVSSRGVTVIEQSPLGITTSVGDFTRGLVFASNGVQELNETYVLPVGKRSTYVNHANELVLTLRKDQRAVRIHFRAYDDGIAFRYALDGSGLVTIAGETSGFRLPAGGSVTYWGQNHPNNYGYETMLGRIEGERMSMPVLVELEDVKHFLFVAQAASYGTYIVPHFERQERQLNVRFPLDQEGPVETALPFQSPWRLAIISPDMLATIVESTLLENLNPLTEPELRNADWIKPGRASWDFLAGDRDKPQVWVNFDVAMGWEYHLVDAGFARRFELPAATRYAREKNIRLIGWGYTPDLNTREKAEEVLAQYAEMGLSGAKLDFFDHHPSTGNKRTQDFEDTQASLKMRDYLMAIAAKRHLVLEFHGCTLPSGERRRYPHFLTAEGVAGMEKRNPKIENELTIPYVRNIMGPVSFTVVKFDRSLGTHAYQMAQTVVYEAGIQIYAERHDRLRAFAGVEFLKNVPSAWDEIRFLDGYPGSHAIYARRKGQDWFIGGMTDPPRTARVALGFLSKDISYQAQLYQDGATKTNLVMETKALTHDSRLEIPMLQNGGFAVLLQAPT
jgi:alpha-glucosidase